MDLPNPGIKPRSLALRQILYQLSHKGGPEKAREFKKIIYFCFIDYAKAFDCVDHKLWKILKEMGIQDHLICLLRNMYAGQEATVRIGHETMDCFQFGKGVCQDFYCHSA